MCARMPVTIPQGTSATIVHSIVERTISAAHSVMLTRLVCKDSIYLSVTRNAATQLALMLSREGLSQRGQDACDVHMES